MADLKITVRANGPYRLEGPFTIVDGEENEFTLPEGQWVSLCRCGNSDNKPFCDGAHRNKTPAFEAETKAT
ncbi:MAG: CDGSH iron-sulfur domain-containing protein [Dehalococcoidia bacterium]|nr:CDGSH iron-sulfur domain-containing protein [Dehalococcoidia bacterium]